MKARSPLAIAALLLALFSAPPRAADAANPCDGPEAQHLLCPNLQDRPATDLYVERAGRPAELLLRATSDVRSRGRGPMELRGSRNGWHTMRVNQRIYRVGGGHLVAADARHAALHRRRRLLRRLLLEGPPARRASSSGRSTGRRPAERLVRTGPKLNYCLRDLERTRPGRRSPSHAHYPGCNQDPCTDAVTLGTSVGWSDIYPADYDKQWINVSGLRGCFAFVMPVDPRNLLYESNENDNSARRLIRLPYRAAAAELPARL